MNPERDFLLELTEAIDEAHDQAPDDATRERLWEIRCKVDERIRRLYREGRDQPLDNPPDLQTWPLTGVEE